MKSHVLAMFLLFLSASIASSSFREHQEFQVSEISQKALELIANVNKEQWMALNLKDSALSVTVSMDEKGVYSLVFVTRYEGINNVNNELLSEHTINFVTVPDATSISQLSADGIKALEKELNKMLPWTVVSESTYDIKRKPLESVQRVSCTAYSKKEVHQLVIAYFSSIKKDMMVWEDSN